MKNMISQVNRNPKAEGRNPKEARRPKSKTGSVAVMADSVFGFRISFGFRASGFGFIQLAALLLSGRAALAQVPPPPPASVAEVQAGAVKNKYVSPYTLVQSGVSLIGPTNGGSGNVSSNTVVTFSVVNATNAAGSNVFAGPVVAPNLYSLGTGTNGYWLTNAGSVTFIITNLPVNLLSTNGVAAAFAGGFLCVKSDGSITVSNAPAGGGGGGTSFPPATDLNLGNFSLTNANQISEGTGNSQTFYQQDAVSVFNGFNMYFRDGNYGGGSSIAFADPSRGNNGYIQFYGYEGWHIFPASDLQLSLGGGQSGTSQFQRLGTIWAGGIIRSDTGFADYGTASGAFTRNFTNVTGINLYVVMTNATATAVFNSQSNNVVPAAANPAAFCLPAGGWLTNAAGGGFYYAQ